MQQHVQLMKPDVFVKLTSQLKTTELLLATERYASPEKMALVQTAMYGRPYRLHVLKMLGALPLTAREYSAREDM
jgi:hypothetical protein